MVWHHRKTGDDKPIEVKIGWVALVDFKLYKQKREIEEQIVKVLNKYIKKCNDKEKERKKEEKKQKKKRKKRNEK